MCISILSQSVSLISKLEYRHCEDRSDVAIQGSPQICGEFTGLPRRCAPRNDDIHVPWLNFAFQSEMSIDLKLSMIRMILQNAPGAI